uniref:Uncharacterized protein n=1 Tax=Anguilla anguilla TaxID=7936 RepID=A0A0E9SRI0_ANGAN
MTAFIHLSSRVTILCLRF